MEHSSCWVHGSGEEISACKGVPNRTTHGSALLGAAVIRRKEPSFDITEGRPIDVNLSSFSAGCTARFTNISLIPCSCCSATPGKSSGAAKGTAVRRGNHGPCAAVGRARSGASPRREQGGSHGGLLDVRDGSGEAGFSITSSSLELARGFGS